MEHPLRGAELDAALERKLELEDVQHQLRDMNVLLDTLADSRDLPPATVRDLRKLQKHVQTVKGRTDHHLDKTEELLY